MKALKLGALALAITSVFTTTTTQASVFGDGWNSPFRIFSKYRNEDGSWGGYRIPGITTTSQGTIIAVADKRFAGTAGNTDIVGGGKVNKVWFSYKVSHDGGRSWSEEGFLKPPTFSDSNTNANAYKNYISDPQIVHNPDTGSTFVFGYQSNSALTVNTGDFDVFVHKSTDGGMTWDKGQSIKNSINLGTGFGKTLQGPGKGMYYQGKIYVPIQQFGPATSNSKGHVASSGFIYSEDDGKTWKQSSWIISDSGILNNGLDPNGNSVSSESSIFHHKGYIYLAGKRDPANEGLTNRMVWRTNDNGKTWESVVEDFIPNNVVGCQSSTLALNDDVYFVAYTTGSGNSRQETYITTNTGKRFKLYDSDNWNNLNSFGYTSITSDQDNIYVLNEGADDNGAVTDAAGAIFMHNFDYAGKDYANLNARLLNSAKDLRYIQDTIMNVNDTHVRGSFGSNDQLGAEAVFVTDKAKLGVFHKSASDVGDDVYRTIGYDYDSTSLVAETSNLLLNKEGLLTDSIFIGYQYNDVDYLNGANDEVNSFIAGYALNLQTDYVDYQFKVNGTFSKHDFTRNNSEGLGKTASFESKVIALTNELSKSFDIFDKKLTVRPFAGLDSTYFKHEGFTEENGNNFNDITVYQSDNWSHGLFIGAQANGTYELNHGMSLEYNAKVRYIHELSDVDDWTDSYRVFDTDFMFAAPVNKDDQENILDASASVILNVTERIGVGIGATIDTSNENMVYGQAKITF